MRPSRYGDGECLCPKDENVVVEKLLSYHPRAQDKIGCGLDAIMVSQPLVTAAQFYSLVIFDFLLKIWDTCHMLVALYPKKRKRNELMIRCDFLLDVIILRLLVLVTKLVSFGVSFI